jgi:hypothetical protein
VHIQCTITTIIITIITINSTKGTPGWQAPAGCFSLMSQFRDAVLRRLNSSPA